MSSLNVNVASGPYVLNGFVNLDNSLFFKLSRMWPLIKPFLSHEKRQIVGQFAAARKRAVLKRFNCKRQLPFPAGTVDHVLCSHFLEHLYSDEALFVIKEFHRILKPGGSLHIILPDLKAHALRYLNNSEPCSADKFLEVIFAYGKKGRSQLHRILDFSGAYGLNHLWMYDIDSISERLSEAGLEVAEGLVTASSDFRHNDGSLHVSAQKK